MINSPKVKFNIIGAGRNLCSELYKDYDPFVNFMGYVTFEELLRQFKTNHLFVFPTMGEGFGLVLLEAMAAGLVPITTNNCGGPDIIQDGENGFIIEVGDTATLVEKIMWCLNHPEEVERMSFKAIEIAKQYTWERYEENIVKTVLKIKELNNI